MYSDWYWLDDVGVGVSLLVGSRTFSSPRSPTHSAAHPVSYPMVIGGSFPGGKAAEVEADHSPPTSAEVKKIWLYTSTPPYAFMA
jgi:hypothetical protein